MKKILIIPDVHGRDFWKEPVKQELKNNETSIVFLGDYLDPYSNIENNDLIENFIQIIKLKAIIQIIILLLLEIFLRV